MACQLTLLTDKALGKGKPYLQTMLVASFSTRQRTRHFDIRVVIVLLGVYVLEVRKPIMEDGGAGGS